MTGTAPQLDRIPPNYGRALSPEDLASLENSWITPELAEAAMLRSVDDEEAAEILLQKGRRGCAGILIPYYWPGEPGPRNYRIRRYHPDLVESADGSLKQERKYLSAPGSRNLLYIPPGVTLEQLADVTIPLVIVEGEKKALSLWRLANHKRKQPWFIPVAIAGVWSWKGSTGKADGPDGERVDTKGPINDFARIALCGRTVYIVFDTNVHTNGSVQAARRELARYLSSQESSVKLVDLPEDCGVNGIDELLASWGPERVLPLFEKATDGSKIYVKKSPQFEYRDDGMYRVSRQGEQLQEIQIANYNARVTASIVLDDGVEQRREFEIEAELMGQRTKFTVGAAEFTRMDWPIEKIGHVAITYPNQHQYARTAIQASSLTAVERHVYTHTGWRKIDGVWVFLSAGGAIGPVGAVPGVEVRLAGALSRYAFPLSPSGDLADAVRASLRLSALASPSVSFTLLAATYRSALGGTDFGIHLVGETGTFKSEFVALLQQHFGLGMDRKHLPGSWSSTANSLEVLAFQAKDTLLVVDDFAPQGSTADVARYHAAAERLFRAVGNQSSRGRLDSTARLREAKPPRSLILSTGEEIPKGHSVRARMLVVEQGKDSINIIDLTACQADARGGLYAQAMAAFIQWIAGDYDAIRTTFERGVTELRAEAMKNAAHARTPEIVANLQAGFELFLDFCVACGAIGPTERDRFAHDCWEALAVTAAAQGGLQTDCEPTVRFLMLLQASLISGKAHLQSISGGMPESPESCGWRMDGQTWRPQGDCVGWVVGDDIYLTSTAAYRVIQVMARDVNDPFAMSEQILKKRLAEKGLLASTDKKRQTLTVRRTITGTQRPVLHFLRATVLPEGQDEEPDDVQ